MNYRQALRYLYRLTDYEKRGPAAYAPEFYNLERVERFLALLDDPHLKYGIVHIAGTKGKGSTAAFSASALRAAGYRTGLFSKPHMHTFRERIQVDGALIPEADVVRLVERMQPLVGELAGITTFEVMVAMAFAWFVEQGVEWAVIEVGLGGRLDATNVVRPAVSAITSISLDHMAILGDTVAQIASEKAGIVKPGVPVVSAPQVPEAMEVIEAACRTQGAPLILVGRDWTWESVESDLDGQTFTLRHGQETLERLRIPLLGEYQLANAATAVAALWVVREAGWHLPDAALREGLVRVQWPGRLEILSRSPWLVVDCAHNGDSARKLMQALRSFFSYRRLIVVLGVSADHATPGLLEALVGGADHAILTRSRHPRAASTAWLRSRASGQGYQVQAVDGVPQALEMAFGLAGPNDLILCTGSVFVAAEARAAWFKRAGLPVPPTDPF